MKQTTLINFNSPNNIKEKFDIICHVSGRTRTSVLVEMMEGYILTQSKVLEVRACELEKANQTIKKFAILSESSSIDEGWAGHAQMDSKTSLESDFEPGFFRDGSDQEIWS